MPNGIGWAIVFVGLLCAAAGAATAAPATTPAAEIPLVKTLRDLKAAPAYMSGGQRVRLGLSAAGDGADATDEWMLLYCLAEPTREKQEAGGIEVGDPLGPVSYTVRPEHLEEMVDSAKVERRDVKETHLYCTAIPLRSGSGPRYLLRVFGDDSNRPLAQRTLPQMNGERYWVAFAASDEERDDIPNAAPRAAVPGQLVNLALADNDRDLRELLDHPLPGALPPGEQSYSAVNADRRKLLEGGIRLELKNGRFVCASAIEFDATPAQNLLARWWVNDKPVPAPPPAARTRLIEHLRAAQAKMKSVDDPWLSTPAAVPEFLHARRGDRVSLQLLYVPNGFCDAPSRYVILEKRRQLQRDSYLPLLSNKLTFAVSDTGKPATLPTTSPASRPATTQAAGIPDVRSLEELKKSPAHRAGGWEVRLGLSDSGPDGGPWVVLYCWAEPKAAENELKVSADCNNVIGPLNYEVTWDNKQIAADLVKRDTPRLAARPALFGATIPVAWDGRCTIRVRDPAGRTLAVGELTTKKKDWYWMNFGTADKKVAAEAWAAMPALPSSASLFGDAKVIEPKGLPGQVPPEQPWIAAMAGEPKKDAAGGLAVTLEDNKFLLIASHGGTMLDWPDFNLLARWWINDQPIVAPVLETGEAIDIARAMRYSRTMGVRLGLPKVVNAKAGDKIGLQLMYTPGMRRRPLKYSDAFADGLAGKEEARIFLVSERIEFKATQEMIAARGAK